MVGVLAHVPGGEVPAGNLALTVPRGHQQHQAGVLAGRHVRAELLQAPADVLVDPADQVFGINPQDERYQPTPGEYPAGQLQL